MVNKPNYQVRYAKYHNRNVKLKKPVPLPHLKWISDWLINKKNTLKHFTSAYEELCKLYHVDHDSLAYYKAYKD